MSTYKGTGDLASNGLSLVLTLADDGPIYKTASDTQTAVTTVQEQLEKVSQWCQETGFENNPSKVQALWCTLDNKALGQAMPAVSFNEQVTQHTNSLRYFGIDFDRMLMQKMQVQQRTVRTESQVCKRHRTTSPVPGVSECDTQHHWLRSGSHNPVTVQPADTQQGASKAMRVILGTIKDTPIEAMLYLLDLPPLETRHKVEQVKTYINAIQNPKSAPRRCQKKKRGIDWQEASHGWAMQYS